MASVHCTCLTSTSITAHVTLYVTHLVIHQKVNLLIIDALFLGLVFLICDTNETPIENKKSGSRAISCKSMSVHIAVYPTNYIYIYIHIYGGCRKAINPYIWWQIQYCLNIIWRPWHGNGFHISGPLWGNLQSLVDFVHTGPVMRSFDVILCCLSGQTVKQSESYTPWRSCGVTVMRPTLVSSSLSPLFLTIDKIIHAVTHI